jgi:hypothetical protein
MTRDQKALAAYGSVVVVGLFLLMAWSRLGGLVLLVLGLAAVTAVLRLTNPRRFRLPPGPRPSGANGPSEEQRALRAELQRRRAAATARTLGRDQRQD